jgi:hypothetical protein
MARTRVPELIAESLAADRARAFATADDGDTDDAGTTADPQPTQEVPL